MIVPKGSMWLTGLSVSRPARLAVSSPKASAAAPWETSCRITEGMSEHEEQDLERGDLVGADEHGQRAPPRR